MKRIAIVYPDLTTTGGAESVCLTIADALSNKYYVDLVTLSKPSINEVEVSSAIDGTGVSVRTINIEKIATGKVVDLISKLTNKNLSNIKESIFNRHISSIYPEYDLVISARSEIYVNGQCLQYIHIPRNGLRKHGKSVLHPNQREAEHIKRIYHKIGSYISGYDPQKLENDVLLANSKWTKQLIREVYSPSLQSKLDIQTVYPPVPVSEFDETNNGYREDGFVTLGRVARGKKVSRSIDIITDLRNRGYDVHLHVVGPISDTEYNRKIIEKAKSKHYVHIEGRVKRSILIEMLKSHKYGLHGKINEPFGISVVEMVAAGMIPIVPRGAGPAEIVGHDNRLLYSNRAEAVDSAAEIISSPELRKSIHGDLPDVSRFSIERFVSEIRDVVNSLISPTASRK